VLAAQLPEVLLRGVAPFTGVTQQGTQLAGENKDNGLDSHESTITPSSEGRTLRETEWPQQMEEA